MKTIFLLLFLIISKACLTQTNAVDQYFTGFQKQHSLDATTVSPKMFTVFLESREGKEKEELAAILKKLTGLKVLNTYNTKDGIALFNAACLLMPKSYEGILTFNEADRNAKFYTREEGGKIRELVMIAFQWGRFLVVSITGEIILTDILNLSQNLNFQGINKLQKIKTTSQ